MQFDRKNLNSEILHIFQIFILRVCQAKIRLFRKSGRNYESVHRATLKEKSVSLSVCTGFTSSLKRWFAARLPSAPILLLNCAQLSSLLLRLQHSTSLDSSPTHTSLLEPFRYSTTSISTKKLERKFPFELSSHLEFNLKL